MLIRNKPVAVVRLVGLLVFFFACWVATQKLHPTEELYYPTELDFARIEMAEARYWLKHEMHEMGETEDEVRAILGPPHKVLTWESSGGWFHRPHEPGERVFLYKAAQEEEDVESYNVTFDVDGRVRGFGRTLRDRRNLFEKTKAWFKNLF